MSKDKLRHRGAEDSKGLMRRVQGGADRARYLAAFDTMRAERVAAHESGHVDRNVANETVLFDSLATGYFAVEAVQARQIARVREQLRREAMDTKIPPSKR